MYNATHDGYILLKAILVATLTIKSARHHWQPNRARIHINMQSISRHYFGNSKPGTAKYRVVYTPREQAQMFFQGMHQDMAHGPAAIKMLHDVNQIPETTQLDPK
jgi:hypothetical protein